MKAEVREVLEIVVEEIRSATSSTKGRDDAHWTRFHPIELLDKIADGIEARCWYEEGD